jgi:hypothetical protein
VLGFFEIGSRTLFAWDWLWTTILLISASWVVRIIGVNKILHFFAGSPAWSSYLGFPCGWDDRHAPSCPAFIGWDGVSWTFCQRLALNLDSPILCLLSGWDYTHKPLTGCQFSYLNFGDSGVGWCLCFLTDKKLRFSAFSALPTFTQMFEWQSWDKQADSANSSFRSESWCNIKNIVSKPSFVFPQQEIKHYI